MLKSRTSKIGCDRRILLIVVFMTAVGASIVASSSSYFSDAKFNDAYFLLKRHIVRILIAALFLSLTLHVDYRIYRRFSPAALFLGLGLLLGLFLFGYAIRDSVRCYSLRFLRLTLQPSEIARFSLVLFLSYWITRAGRELTDFKRGFLVPALAVGCTVALIASQPNYGCAAATGLVALLVLFLGGARLTHLAALTLTGCGAAALKIWSVPYVRERILAFIHRGENLTEANWQIHQSLIALGSGGIFGAGFGESRQKLSWLPDSHTDFTFSILGEEAGLIGTCLVSSLFLLFALRALKISRSCGDTFGEMLAVGLGSSIFVHAAFNMAVATGLFPVTGLPLPFLSYGGTALVMNAVSVGVLLNISRQHQRSPIRRVPRTERRVRGRWASP